MTWRAISGRHYCEALLDELYAGIVGKRGGGGAMPRRRHTEEDRRLLREICTWASGRGQTLMRTVRGLASYADATRVLARLEGIPEHDIEPLVMAKYNHLICAQVYGSAGNEEKDEQLNELMAGRCTLKPALKAPGCSA